MCGIACACSFSPDGADGRRASAASMSAALAHRGPDGRGARECGAASLAHRRLSLLDLTEAGAQPMGLPGDDVWISFNGEIYNYRELRAELSADGTAFVSGTDTEVLLRGYRRWGLDGLLPRLRGMFAFALWDGRRRGGTLYLARDRYGIKPLYYAREGGLVRAASEVRALAAGGVSREEDPDAWLAFLLFGFVPAPLTTLRAAKALPAGHYAEQTVDAWAVKRWYAPPTAQGPARGAAERADETRRLLEESVALHLVADAPLGVFLSGGLDSTALAALAVRAKPDLITLGVSFDEDGFSERGYQELAAKALGTRHVDVRVSRRDFDGELEKYFASLDQPTVDGVNTYFIARAARGAGLKAVLSGIGADELYGGYGTLRRADRLAALARVPGAAGLAAAGLSRWRPALGRLSGMAHAGALPFYLALRGLFAPAEAARLSGATEAEVWRLLERLEPGETAPRGARLQQDLEFDFYLRDQLLKDADVLGMAHSVEIRVPFLDHRLVEDARAHPAPDVLRRPKGVLRDAVAGRVPPEILARPKQGFGFPLERWLDADANGAARPGGHWSRRWALTVRDRLRGARA